jgi:hypothetical protein
MTGSFRLAAWAVAAFSAISVAASAQAPQPYSGMQARQVKALSDQQIADLKAGRGMGLALAAELNGYPGPSHLLELSRQLELTPAQRSSLEEMYNAMKAETIPLGETLLGEERQLDRLFSEMTISAQQLQTATTAIGELQGRLRNAHLSYHLRAREILQPSQVRRYAELRGYGEQQEQMPHQRHHE